MLQIKGHCSYFGDTGYNVYSRGFFKALKLLYPKIFVRNYTEYQKSEISYEDALLVDETTVYLEDKKTNVSITPPWCNQTVKPSVGDINIILNETNHCYFYENYTGLKIAYNMWETTQQPTNFTNKLHEYDQVWVPSEWQKKMMMNQGISLEKIHVVPGGVDKEFIYLPRTRGGVIKFLIVGAWCYRKSTKMMIELFLKVFKEIENVQLTLIVENDFSRDGMKSTEDRLNFNGLNSPKIKVIKDRLNRNDYVKMVQDHDCILSCSRGEGWNLPLIEALACGIPSIFSDCCSHKDFASEYPLKVPIKEMVKAVCKEEHVDFPGEYHEPDWECFERMLLDFYKNPQYYSKIYVDKSEKLRTTFSWENSAKTAITLLVGYTFKINQQHDNKFYTSSDFLETLKSSNDTVNNFIYKEIFEYEIYNNLSDMKIKMGDVVMDVGAHIGIFSRYAAKQGASRVISVEMDPKFFSCLRKNIRSEDDAMNCVLLDKTFTMFKLDNDLFIIGFRMDHFYNGGLFDKLDFLKIDISGKEMVLLKSISKEIYDKIEKVSVKMYNLSDQHKTEVIEFMRNNGYLKYHNLLIANQPIQLLYFWK